MLLNLREQLVQPSDGSKSTSTFSENIAAKSYTSLMKHPSMVKLGNIMLKGLQKPFVRDGVVSSVPIPPLSIWTRSRDLPKLPDKTFHQIWENNLKDNQDTNG